MTRILAVTNHKGGVGKTTIATHLAAGLAIKGHHVGLVDTDSQGHSGLMFGVEQIDGLYDLLVGGQSLETVVHRIDPSIYSDKLWHDGAGSLALIPSYQQTWQIPHTQQAESAFSFLKAMRGFGNAYGLDVIIIDTNPTLSAFDAQTYLATDGFIYVTECERLSFEGIGDAVGQMQMFADDRREFLGLESQVVGIVPNKLFANTSIHRANIAVLAQHFGPEMVWQPLRRLTVWVEATEIGEVLFKYAPTDEATVEAWNIVNRTEKWLKQCQETETAP